MWQRSHCGAALAELGGQEPWRVPGRTVHRETSNWKHSPQSYTKGFWGSSWHWVLVAAFITRARCWGSRAHCRNLVLVKAMRTTQACLVVTQGSEAKPFSSCSPSSVSSMKKPNNMTSQKGKYLNGPNPFSQSWQKWWIWTWGAIMDNWNSHPFDYLDSIYTFLYTFWLPFNNSTTILLQYKI